MADSYKTNGHVANPKGIKGRRFVRRVGRFVCSRSGGDRMSAEGGLFPREFLGPECDKYMIERSVPRKFVAIDFW